VAGTLPTPSTFTATVDMTAFTQMELTVSLCNPTGWTVHVGDSPTNNGGGGDASTFSNCAELQLLDTTMTGLTNDYDPVHPGPLFTSPGYMPATGCTTFTWIVSDQRVQSSSPVLDYTSPYLLRLNPPADLEGPPDALWYVGLDRTYGEATRSGTGVQTGHFCLR
jgi:hypothetical protein